MKSDIWEMKMSDKVIKLGVRFEPLNTKTVLFPLGATPSGSWVGESIGPALFYFLCLKSQTCDLHIHGSHGIVLLVDQLCSRYSKRLEEECLDIELGLMNGGKKNVTCISEQKGKKKKASLLEKNKFLKKFI